MAAAFNVARLIGWRNAGRLGPLLWLATGVAIVAAVAWVDRDTLSTVGTQLAAVDWRIAVLALPMLVSVELAKALRWQVLYGQHRPVYRRVLQATVLGQAANALVPLRLGDVVRVSWAAPSGAGVARGTAGLVLTKAIDALILGALILLVFGASLLAQANLIPIVALGLVLAVGLGLAQRYQAIGGGGLGAVRPLLAAAARYARELSPATLAIVIAVSGLAWIIGGLVNMLVLAAVGAPTTVDLAARMLASAYVAGLLPAPPGRVGVFEGTVAAALVGGGLDLGTALAAAILLHLMQLLEIGLLFVAATRWR